MGLPCCPPLFLNTTEQYYPIEEVAWGLPRWQHLLTHATETEIVVLLLVWYWGAESSRGSGCGEVCYGHIISYIRIYHLVKQWVCLFTFKDCRNFRDESVRVFHQC